LAKLNRSAVRSIGVLEARESMDWRLSEFERDWRLLLEVEVDVEVVDEDVDSAEWSEIRVPFRVGAMESGVADRLLVPLLRACGCPLRAFSAVVICVLPIEKSFGSSGVVEGQLESELSSEDLAAGVLARELEVVVFVERDLEERRSSCVDSVV
jgi:hypothetical protein